jgi:hypothetical protein
MQSIKDRAAVFFVLFFAFAAAAVATAAVATNILNATIPAAVVVVAVINAVGIRQRCYMVMGADI